MVSSKPFLLLSLLTYVYRLFDNPYRGEQGDVMYETSMKEL